MAKKTQKNDSKIASGLRGCMSREIHQPGREMTAAMPGRERPCTEIRKAPLLPFQCAQGRAHAAGRGILLFLAAGPVGSSSPVSAVTSARQASPHEPGAGGGGGRLILSRRAPGGTARINPCLYRKSTHRAAPDCLRPEYESGTRVRPLRQH